MAAMVATDTVRGQLMLMLTTVAMDMVATDTARGQLMPMPTTVATDMAAMVATDTARGRLMPMLTMAVTDMAATGQTWSPTPSPTFMPTEEHHCVEVSIAS